MISFYSQGEKYHIAETSDEITLSQYLQLEGVSDIHEQISILSGLPNDKQLDEDGLVKLAIMCDYFTKGIELPETDLKPLQLNELAIGVTQYCELALSTQPKHEALILMLCYIYSDVCWSNPDRPKPQEKDYDKWSSVPAWQYLPLLIDYVNQIEVNRKTWNKSLASNYTAEEVRAGVRKLEKFGTFGTFMSLAGKDFDKYDKLYTRKWYEILLLLKLGKEEKEYQKKYSEIITKKR